MFRRPFFVRRPLLRPGPVVVVRPRRPLLRRLFRRLLR